MTAKCLHNDSFRVAYDIIHAMPLQAYQYLRHLEMERGKIPGRSSKSLEALDQSWASLVNSKTICRVTDFYRSTNGTHIFLHLLSQMCDLSSLLSSHKWHTSKKSQSSFGPLMTTSTSQMASLANWHWQIPNKQQSIISNTSNRLDFCAVAPSIFSVWSSWRERILDILKRQRWI